ncbi:MAG: hypothetical protein ACOH1O_10280 [Flavobacterium sp.]
MRNQQIKIFIVIIIAFSFPYEGFAQSTAKAIVKENNINFVNNKIKFTVGWASKKSKENGLQVGYGDRFFLDLTDNQLQKIESLRCDELLILLKDDKTDWATNLILYYIYEESAALFYPDYDDTRQKWLRFSKGNDIKFWTEKFAKYGN